MAAASEVTPVRKSPVLGSFANPDALMTQAKKVSAALAERLHLHASGYSPEKHPAAFAANTQAVAAAENHASSDEVTLAASVAAITAAGGRRRPSHLQLSPAAAEKAPPSPPPIGSAGGSATPTRASEPPTPQSGALTHAASVHNLAQHYQEVGVFAAATATS